MPPRAPAPRTGHAPRAGRVDDRRQDRRQPRAVDERQRHDLHEDRQVVGVAQATVGTVGDGRRPGTTMTRTVQRPPRAATHHQRSPCAASTRAARSIRAARERRRSPGLGAHAAEERVERHHRGSAGARLPPRRRRAGGARCAPRRSLQQPLGVYGTDQGRVERLRAHHESSTNSAPKPGPIAARTPVAGTGSPESSRSPSTKRTAGGELPTSASERQERANAAGGSSRARSKACRTLGPPVCASQCRTPARERPWRARKPSTSSRMWASTTSARSREHYLETALDDVPAHHTLGVGVERRRRRDHLRAAAGQAGAGQHRAAAPSPNRPEAMMLGIEKSSRCRVREHSSTRGRARRPPESRSASGGPGDPAAPPAQPRPNSGERITSGRRPRRLTSSASMLGVAMPVVVTKNRWSTSAAPVRPWTARRAPLPPRHRRHSAATPRCAPRRRSAWRSPRWGAPGGAPSPGPRGAAPPAVRR